MNADLTGVVVSPQHSKKKIFLDNFKRCLAQHGNSKHLIEAAAVTGVKLCKASTYISNSDSNHIALLLVQSIMMDLKVRKFEFQLNANFYNLTILKIFFIKSPF